jgi:hypothetical protein
MVDVDKLFGFWPKPQAERSLSVTVLERSALFSVLHVSGENLFLEH